RRGQGPATAWRGRGRGRQDPQRGDAGRPPVLRLPPQAGGLPEDARRRQIDAVALDAPRNLRPAVRPPGPRQEEGAQVMRWLLLLIPVPLVGLYLLTGVVQVRPGERAVIRRFGRVLEDKPGPGLLVGLPWGMDRVDRVEVDAVRELTIGYDGDPGDGSIIPAGQLLTGDSNLVNVQFTLYYKVSPD